MLLFYSYGNLEVPCLGSTFQSLLQSTSSKLIDKCMQQVLVPASRSRRAFVPLAPLAASLLCACSSVRPRYSSLTWPKFEAGPRMVIFPRLEPPYGCKFSNNSILRGHRTAWRCLRYSRVFCSRLLLARLQICARAFSFYTPSFCRCPGH